MHVRLIILSSVLHSEHILAVELLIFASLLDEHTLVVCVLLSSVYDSSERRALYYGVLGMSLECLFGSYFAVGAVTQDHVCWVLFIRCQVKLLFPGVSVFCLQLSYSRYSHGCETLHLSPSDFYLFTCSVIQKIRSHFKYWHGLLLDTVDSDELA